ncbi:tetratricopeptide repeat protein [Erythrobacter sp. MTPC3]|uniref:SPOR domain-containing protein n=1 Tax=Erythrobacter sp. MTPC3 TaxID=3056564 RepID=UPI0036F2CA0C
MTFDLSSIFAGKSIPLGLALALAAATGAAPLAAQSSGGREVVQPLPSKEIERLNAALKRLAKRPKSIAALVEAGEASLNVGDLDAAIGFYGRAEDLSPNNPRVKLGMASVYLRSGRPVEALPLFAAAQSAGAEAKELLSDRGLAFDLVGDSINAQAVYERAITLQPADDEAKRRLALSYAITGNRTKFEEILRPMLDRRDFASFRTRAFGLAIMGDQDRAAAIVDAVMPRDLAARITPYLEYMPRLTKSQQAAAANLGIFPSAADIGREDPRIAAFVGEASPTASINTMQQTAGRLEPSGEPLGSQNAVPTATSPAPIPASVPSANVADAFSDLGYGTMPGSAAGADAVNLAAIQIPRETTPSPQPAAEPVKPDHPSRIWVQVATGRNVSALVFDWRRLSRRAPDLLGDFTPHVTPWGQANRLLAGPVESREAARDLINALGEQGIDTFRYTSPEGAEIKELK